MDSAGNALFILAAMVIIFLVLGFLMRRARNGRPPYPGDGPSGSGHHHGGFGTHHDGGGGGFHGGGGGGGHH